MKDRLFDSLEVRNFRAFDLLQIEQLGHINLIVGKNNVGKSTLLEAIYLHANIGSPNIMRGILDKRGESYSTEYSNLEEPDVSKLFYGYPDLDTIKNPIHIGRTKAPDSTLSLSIEWEENKIAPAFVVQFGSIQLSLPLEKSFDEIAKIWELSLKKNADNLIITPCIYVSPDGLSSSMIQSLWKKIVEEGNEHEIVTALQLIDKNVEDFILVQNPNGEPSFRIRRKGQKGAIPIKALGDGMNRLAGLSMALVCSQKGILLIDEIENGLYWGVQPDVWKFIVKVAKELDVQVFATTHSNDCLRAFYTGIKDDADMEGIAVRLEKRKAGFHTEIYDEVRLKMNVDERIEIR